MMSRKIIYMICLLAAGLVSGCGYNDFGEPEPVEENPESNVTMAELRVLYERVGVTTFSRDYVLDGVVTASDKSGNFYRTFIVEDVTGAVEVKAGLYDLHTLYPIGRKVSVRLKGLTLGRYNGMYQVGLKGAASSGYEVDFLGHKALVDRYVVRQGMDDVFRPKIVGVEQITDELVGSVVALYGLTLEGGGEITWATPAEESYNGKPADRDVKAVDINGREIFIYTSAYADFAWEVVPAGYVSVTGIVMKNGNKYRLKIRDLRDVAAQ